MINNIFVVDNFKPHINSLQSSLGYNPSHFPKIYKMIFVIQKSFLQGTPTLQFSLFIGSHTLHWKIPNGHFFLFFFARHFWIIIQIWKVFSKFIIGQKVYQLLYGCCCCCCEVASVVSDSVPPHRWQPTRLLCPWDSPGKKTGVGCHFLLQCMKVKSESEVTFTSIWAPN